MTKTRSMPRHPLRHPVRQTDRAQRLLRGVLIDALVQAGFGGTDQPPLRVTPAALATAPARMAAAAADVSTREQLAASYERCLASYRAIEQARGAEADVDDVGRAVAFFVAVNLHVLHGVEGDEDTLVTLERQLRLTARACSNWDAASVQERQFFFEQIAIISVLVSGSWAMATSQDQAAKDNVRRAARRYLQQMLGLNPDMLTFGPKGMLAREPHGGAATATVATA